MLSCGAVCMILHLAVSVEHRLVTDRWTHNYGLYCTSMASRVKNSVSGISFVMYHLQLMILCFGGKVVSTNIVDQFLLQKLLSVYVHWKSLHCLCTLRPIEKKLLEI